MEVGWSAELNEPIVITELTEKITIKEKADIYVRTEDDGYIILAMAPLRIIQTNIQEVAIYPILSVHMLSDQCPDDLFARFETLTKYSQALENDSVIAEALGFEYVEYKIRSRPDW